MRAMRNVVAVVVVVAAGGMLAAGDVLSQLGVSKDSAAETVLNSLEHGYVPAGMVRGALKKATPEGRAAIVEQVLVWTKAYLSSPAFKSAYARLRESSKPDPLAERGSPDAEIRKQSDELSQQIAEMRKAAASLPADQRKMIEDSIKELQASQKQQAADPEMAKAQREGMALQAADEQREHKERLAAWEKAYPANPRDLIARRLREFLDASAGVDYSAKLVPANGKQRFANPAYESKSSEWKLCYRAGKPAVDKARAFAQAWLAELK